MNDDDETVIDIDSLMDDKGKTVYNKWLDIFETITPFNIPKAFDSIIDSHTLTKSDSAILLSYIKFFEQRIFEMSKQEIKRRKNTKKGKYDGVMYG